jgi:hypothetical protein
VIMASFKEFFKRTTSSANDSAMYFCMPFLIGLAKVLGNKL